MNCNSIRNQIHKYFTDGASTADMDIIREHCSTCDDCAKLFAQEQMLTEGLKDLDSSQYRQASIDSFGRLALAVRSHRTSKPAWYESLQLKPVRLATVSAFLLVFLVALSTINFSYSHTTGAKLKLTFDPPLQKSEQLPKNQFYALLNNDISSILKPSTTPDNVSWALQVDQDALRGISIDIETDNPRAVSTVFDSLTDKHPIFVRGHISISPLRKEVRTNAFKAITQRKPHTLNDDEIRAIVSTDLPVIIDQVEQRNVTFENDSENLKTVIIRQMPEIRKLFGKVANTSKDPANMGVLIAIPGETIDQPSTDNQENIRDSFKKQVAKLIKINAEYPIGDQKLEQILNLEVYNSKAKLVVGDKDKLFSPSASNAKIFIIIRDSNRHVDLDGFDDFVKSHEIDDLLMGKIHPNELQNRISERLDESHRNELIIIEIWQGEKRAEIKISDNTPEVILTAPPLPSNIRLPLSPDPRMKEESEDYKQLMELMQAEREYVLMRFDNTNRIAEKPVIPDLTHEYSFLSDWVSDHEVIDLMKGTITEDDLEQIISQRVQAQGDTAIDETDIMMIRDGVRVTIKISKDEVRVEMSDDVEFSNMSNGAVVIKHPSRTNSGVDQSNADGWM